MLASNYYKLSQEENWRIMYVYRKQIASTSCSFTVLLVLPHKRVDTRRVRYSVSYRSEVFVQFEFMSAVLLRVVSMKR